VVATSLNGRQKGGSRPSASGIQLVRPYLRLS
jgi:hypothetical protein